MERPTMIDLSADAIGQTWTIENHQSLVCHLKAVEKLAQDVIATRGKEVPLTFRRLQDEQRPWVQHNFAGRHNYYPLLGAVEELGELAHAHLKQLQGIRGTPAKLEADAKDAIGDTVIFLADYCTARNFDFQKLMEETWAKVKQRDWKADPMNGRGTECPRYHHSPVDPEAAEI